MSERIYFSDKFFSSGRTEIVNENQEKIGSLNLKSVFSPKVEVENKQGEVILEGSFTFLSNKWVVLNGDGDQLGVVKTSFSFFSKQYKYFTRGKVIEIESPAFSKEYRMVDENGIEVATFRKVNAFFQTTAFELHNSSDDVQTEELIAVIMGVNAFEKTAASAGGGGAV
ncbi:hypothetical protein [Guptibacillus hwajinpoensis]|uniref:Phage tail protein n=1 Tax=Guptibacillus hwajinpoensis TaxID=208199 RepID=A0ABU0JXH3_9BACL|nr:hypothetical protein [Alkalihalobacillus hemicentroti]MDQ0481776.1 hypothetical protein [Alkalihalobacillus hemicentroti]